jgi:hypothetical protein
MACAAFPPVKNLIRELLFTHNTLISVLYAIILSTDTRYIRCCKTDGEVYHKGAQFRYGIDSQYGDIVFVMKPSFWRGMKGYDSHKSAIVQNPVFGHVHRHDFIEYNGAGNINLVERWFEQDARYFDFRRPAEESVRVGHGKECKGQEWSFSWCNIQMHLANNVELKHVEKVYAPAWVVYDETTTRKMQARGINATLLRQLVSNQLPFYPHGDHAVNELNGKFHLYGPPLATQHYHKVERRRGKIEEDLTSFHTYNSFDLPRNVDNQSILTYRYAQHSTSTVFLHERAFRDLEVRYMLDLVQRNMTDLDPELVRNVTQCMAYRYE